ncbi:MAG: N-6 DNA methylase [bacterium]|nr:N-6 DNA methylase [bacterium]MCM1374777.1 N-6 DNA methylase [Muribaculum sp.]
MQLSADVVRELIVAIGFVPQNGKTGIYYKTYVSHKGYTIFVDMNQGLFIYDADVNDGDSVIKVWNEASSNFSYAENLVVLECINHLLVKGYAPSCIELEKTYPSGHGHSGRLDILIRSENGKPFLMIECKTWGEEYEKELRKMLKNGGQLFPYYSSDRDADYLCLYSSRMQGKVEYENAIIDVDPAWRSLSGVKEIVDHWNKNYRDNGIFDDHAFPYHVKHKALVYSKLMSLREEDSGKIYNQIMEILRHNAISDKSNAFNKLLNLFVCKIVDENKNPDDELEFQWLETDTDESLQMRLNDLYKEGMLRFLDIKVIDYAQEDVAQRLRSADLDPETRQWIMRMYTDTRLKKSPNFAFVEVQDEKTFALNAKVVREIVLLLQGFKFRYEQRHEFLGNFFELLLNTSMKQEAGQFFTPVPITRFIISSLPLRSLVQRRVDQRIPEPLPAVIDYACGSGHFLTEYMSQMQKIIDSEIELGKAAPDVRDSFLIWQGIRKFLWAQNTVYGIDLDNRLVKTTKVSAFFNGDGEAQIVWANGLDHFTRSDAYRGKLACSDGMDNGQFDILISNPPYSVEAFKSTVNYGEQSFELYPYLTDNSSEIECLFVERMKQLLKVGGWAAVVLPSTILTSTGIYARARELLMKYFQVIAIVEMGSQTFMETVTNTVILFLERRSNDDHRMINRAIDRFIDTKQDVTVAGIENAFSTYVANVYEELPFADYISFLNGTPTENTKKHELYQDYRESFGNDYLEKAIMSEKDKMLYFLLTYSQNIVLIKTGKGKQEKQFLGYEFSKRRGHEGLHWLPGGTRLYNESDPTDPLKASSYIYRAFLGEEAPVDGSMAQNVSYGRLSSFLEYGTGKFDKRINLGKRIRIRSPHPMERLENLANIVSGVTYVKGDQIYEESHNIVLTADNISIDGSFQIAKLIYLRADMDLDSTKRLCKGDIFICLSSGSKEHVGKCAVIETDTPYYAGGFMGIVRTKQEIILPKYLWAVLSSAPYRAILSQNSTGSNIHNIGRVLSDIKIPVLPLGIQQKIVREIEALEKEYVSLHDEIEQNNKAIERLYDEAASYPERLLGQIAQCNPPKAEIADITDDTLISFVEMAAVSNDGYIVGAIDRPLGDVRKGSYTYFRDKDIIIAKITPCMENGKCALAQGMTNQIGMGSSEFHVLRCDSDILPRYLFGYLNRAVIRIEAEKVMTGKSGHRRVPITFYQQLKLPLPTLDDQKRVVDELERYERKNLQIKERLNELIRFKASVIKKYL